MQAVNKKVRGWYRTDKS